MKWFTLFPVLLSGAVAQVTIYATPTSVGGAPATSPTLSPPPIPAASEIPKTIDINLGASTPLGASIQIPSNFFGWSIELSSFENFIGSTPSSLQAPFLNYLAALRNRAKAGTILRIGGNSQDQAFYDPNSSRAVSSQGSNASTAATSTPYLTLGPNLFDVMNNVSDLLATRWILGVNFASITNDSNAVLFSSTAESQLSSRLYGLQLGNEPDLYPSVGRRPTNWSIPDYISDWGVEVENINSTNPFTRDQIFIGPSVCCNWDIGTIVADGYLAAYRSSLDSFAVQHYPDNNCAAIGKSTGTPVVPQNILSNYLNHTGAIFSLQQYIPTIPTVLANGLPLLMLETNTASCGGFPGVSNAFAATLWTIDYALQMAYLNFSLATFHMSGTNTFYNPFSPPPSTQTFLGWSTEPLFYSSLVVTEALGSRNLSQVIDLQTASAWYPAYAIYESGTPARVLLINYVDDPTGSSDYSAVISVPSNPSSVTVRYLSSSSVVEQSNITYAGQTWDLSTDGLPSGNVTDVPLTCDTSSKTCTIPVRAPSVALVFLTAAALSESSMDPTATVSYGSSGGSLVSPSSLATSDGRGGTNQQTGATDPKGLGSTLTLSLRWLATFLIGSLLFCRLWTW